MADNRAPPTYDQLVTINNEINARLYMHKFVTSPQEREMLKKQNPAMYEKRLGMMNKFGAQAYTLKPVDEAELRGMKRANLEAQQKIAQKEGADAAYWANFYEKAENAALVTRNVATGALIVVGTVATGGALLAPLTGVATVGGASMMTVGTVAFTGLTIANLSGKIAEGKQLDGGDYADILLTVLPFGAGKAGLLLKETLGAARAAKAAKLIQEAEQLAKAEKTPVAKALEKVLQGTAKGREAVKDFVLGCRNRVINPSSGLGKILKESEALKQAQQEAKALEKAMRQNMKDQGRLQKIMTDLEKLQAAHPEIKGQIDPNLLKELERKGIKMTNAWTAADGRVMSAAATLNKTQTAVGRLRNIKVNAVINNTLKTAGAVLNKPTVKGGLVAGGMYGAYRLGQGQSTSPNAPVSGINQVNANYYEVAPQKPNNLLPAASGSDLDSNDYGTAEMPLGQGPSPAVIKTFEILPEVQELHAEVSSELAKKSNIQTVTNIATPHTTIYDQETNTLKAADLSKMNGYWQQVSVVFRQQLVGMTPEQVAYYTGEGKAEMVSQIRTELKDVYGIVPSGEAAPVNNAGTNPNAPDHLGDRKEFVNTMPIIPGNPSGGGRAVTGNDPSLFPPRIDNMPIQPGNAPAPQMGGVPAGPAFEV